MIPVKDYKYVHVPKTGGTAIVQSLVSIYGLDYDKLSGHMSCLNFMANIDSKSMPFTFTIVRDPVEVIKSFYKFVLADSSYYHNANNPHKARALLAGKSFDEFVDILYSLPTTNDSSLLDRWILEGKGPKIYNEQRFRFWGLKPQWYYVADTNGKIIVDYINSHRNIKTAYNEIVSEIFGQKITDAVLLVINKPIGAPVISCSEKSISKIQELYQRDYELLGTFL